MPELAEVETIRTQLVKTTPLEIIKESRSSVSSSILHTPEITIEKSIIESIARHGKILIFNLDNERRIVSQLGMSGTWRISERPLKEKHKHIEYQCNGGKKKYFISYVDPRRFGHLYYWEKDELDKYLAKQGHDPTHENFTIPYLKKALVKYPEREIKVTLLDQKLFAGVGNYMASEICAFSKIKPTRKCGKIKNREFELIYEAFKVVLKGGLESGGLTFQGGYQDAYGNSGGGLDNLAVFYQKICRICKKTNVIKIMQKGRGTYYCPYCQK